MGKVDMASWDRREQFAFFNKLDCPYFGLTVELDVTEARAFMKNNAIGSYAGMIYLVSRALNGVEELRLRIRGDAVWLHDVVHPSFTVLTRSNRLNFCRGRYVPDAESFLKAAQQLMDAAKDERDLELDPPGDDLIYISCLPWLHFTAISHPVPLSPADSFPRITWGRFEPRAGRVVVALNIQAHHGLADGVHVARFLGDLEKMCAAPHAVFCGGTAG